MPTLELLVMVAKRVLLKAFVINVNNVKTLISVKNVRISSRLLHLGFCLSDGH